MDEMKIPALLFFDNVDFVEKIPWRPVGPSVSYKFAICARLDYEAPLKCIARRLGLWVMG